MNGGERPRGAAKGKQSDTEALCQPPPPPPHARPLLGGKHPRGWKKLKEALKQRNTGLPFWASLEDSSFFSPSISFLM